MRLVTSGANPVELRQGILAASGFIIEQIKEMAVPVGKNEVKIPSPLTLSVVGTRFSYTFVLLFVGGGTCIDNT